MVWQFARWTYARERMDVQYSRQVTHDLDPRAAIQSSGNPSSPLRAGKALKASGSKVTSYNEAEPKGVTMG